MTATLNASERPYVFDSSCPSCGGHFRAGRHAWIYECDTCGLLKSNLPPQIPEVRSTSRVDEAGRLRGLSGPRRMSNAVILDALEGLFGNRTRTILDVGCGHGLFMTDATNRGFSCQGIEPDANVFEVVAAKGYVVRRGYFPEVLPGECVFDAIVFNDVFEHMPDAAATLDACRHHLAPNGILVLNCPSRSGFFYRLADLLDRLGLHGPFDRLWQRGLPSPHLWYFSPEDLHRLANAHGFEVSRTIRLAPLGLAGLKQRIFHIQGQSKLMSWSALLATLVVLPFLTLLPKDTGIVVCVKRNEP